MNKRLLQMAGSTLLLCLPFAAAHAAFPDVRSTNVHLQAITELQTKGIMTGNDQGMFLPAATINRAELTKIIVGTQFSADEITKCDVKAKLFSDVRSTDWFAKYVCVAKANNIISGYADGSFKPAQAVNYAEAAKIIVMSVHPDAAAAVTVRAGSPWYTVYVSTVTSLEAAPTSTIMPADALNRAEAAQLLYNLKFGAKSMMMMGVEVGGAMMVPSLDIVANAANANNVTTLVAAVQAAGLVDTLKGTGPFTVFAPIDSAFAALPEGTVSTLLKVENKAQLTDILTYHVVAGRYTSADLKNNMELTTVEGKKIKITYDGTTWMVNNAKILIPDIISSNGVTFAIDTVLMPSDDMMGVEVGGAMMVPSLDIVANAANANNVTTLVAAVQAAGLVDTLKGTGPFTVFAPIDSAFAALPEGTVSTLLKVENKAQLTDILTYHVVAGRYTSADLKNNMELTTVEGKKIKITYDGTTWMVNNAKILIPDIISSNGVTFAIDTVLMPN